MIRKSSIKLAETVDELSSEGDVSGYMAIMNGKASLSMTIPTFFAETLEPGDRVVVNLAVYEKEKA